MSTQYLRIWLHNGVTAFTYKGMYKTLVRFKNNVEAKLMRGNLPN